MFKSWGTLVWCAALSLLMMGCGSTDRAESLGINRAAIDTGQALVIRQVYSRPDSPTSSLGTFNCDFVEIYNKGNSSASLSGLSVQRAVLSGPFGFQLPLPAVTLAPGQSYLIAGPVVDASPTLPVLPDIGVTGTPNGQFIGQAGVVALVRGTSLLGCGNTTVCSPTALARIVDLVAYGTGAKPFEGLVGPAPSALTDTTSLQRKVGGTQDTNDNAADFLVTSPEPRNMDTVPPIASPAPALPTGSAAPFGTLTDFIHDGSAAADQTGVTADAIDPNRAGWVVGYVKDGNGVGLGGVTVSVIGQGQYGHATTRSDGRFDMAVNGGATYTFHFSKTNYFDADRQLYVGWQRTAAMEDVWLVAPDANSKVVTDTDTFQVAVATTTQPDTVDTKARTAVLMVPAQTKFKTPGGSLPSLTLRLTEYTAGPNGLKRMPAPLNSSPAYTYAVEISAVEAAGQSVNFTEADGITPRDVFFYVDDFIGGVGGGASFPVGTPVPTGYYDRTAQTWIASKSGTIIKVSVTNGVALVDTDGVGGFDNSTQLTAFGITSSELSALATRYGQAGVTKVTTLWRVPINHMTPYDCNFPALPPPCESVCPGPDGDGHPPPPPKCGGAGGSSAGSAGGENVRSGSIVGCDSQILGESTNVAGTPYTLNYSSFRTQGYAPKRQFKIDLTGAVVHSKEGLITVDLAIAGQLHHREFVPIPNLSWTFQWDGLDGAGRTVVGGATATALINSYFEAAGYAPVAKFGDMPSPTINISTVPSRRAAFKYQRVLEASLYGAAPSGSWSLGDWTLSQHHFLDLATDTVHLGSGLTRPASLQRGIVSRIMGDGGSEGFAANGSSATAPGTGISGVRQNGVGAVAVAPNGDVFIADTFHNVVRRIDSNGTIQTVIGSGQPPCTAPGPLNYANTAPGDPNPDATTANIETPRALAIGADGSIYIATGPVEGTIRKATPVGNGKYSISTYAGGRDACTNEVTRVASIIEGSLATTARFSYLDGVAVAPDGSVLIADSGDMRVTKVDGTGHITILAGNGGSAFAWTDDGKLAKTVPIRAADVAVGRDGTVYFTSNSTLNSVDRNGVLHYLDKQHVAGTNDFVSEGVPMSTQIIDASQSIATRKDGSVVFFTRGTPANGGGASRWIRSLDSKGIVNSISSSLQALPTPAGPSLALGNSPDLAWGLAVAPNDDVLEMSDNSVYRITTTKSSLDVTKCADGTNSKYLIGDGDSGYCFDAGGVHRKTIDLHTNQALYTFAYNNGVLNTITDQDARVTTVNPVASGYEVIPPGGTAQKTTITLTNGHATAITDSIGQSMPTPFSNGLLQTFKDGENNNFAFGYDIDGRLASDQSALGTQHLSRSLIPGGRRVTHTTPGGRVTKFDATTDAAGVLTHTTTLPDLSTEIKSSNSNGTEITIAPDGTITTTQLSAVSKFGGQTMIDGVEVTKLPSGNTRTIKRTSTDPTGGPQVNKIIYDDTVATPIAQTTTNTYSTSTQSIAVVSPEGRTFTTTLDGKGHVTQTQAGTVALGRLTPVVYGYTSNRLTSQTQGGRFTNYSYFPTAGQPDTGYLWHIQDALSTTELRHDLRDRLLSRKAALGTLVESTPSFTWFKNDVLKTVRTPELLVDHTFSYNAVKEIQQFLPPSAGVTAPATNYTYTNDRDLSTEQRTDQLWGSKTITRTYIPSTGQLDTIVLPATSLSSLSGIVNYDYYTSSNTSGASAGRVSKVTGPTSTNNVQYLYDGALRTSMSWTGDVTGQVTWTYNNRFWPNKETLVAGSTFDRFIGYDNDGLIVCNSPTTCSPSAGTDALKILHSMIHGRVSSITQGAATETWTYSDTPSDYSATPASAAFGELREQSAVVGGTTVADIVYDAAGGATSERRDASGRIRFKTETFRNATAPFATVTNKWEYIYDERGQLKSTKNNGNPVFDASYDKNGNIKQVSVSGGAPMSCVVDAQDRLTSCGGLTLTYYDNGEVRTKTNAAGTWTYHYDALGRLRVVVKPDLTQIEYILDGEGRRIAKKVGGVGGAGSAIQRRWLYHDALSPIAEFDGNGTLLARYVYGSRKNTPDLVIKGSSVYRLISDQLGSPRYAVNVANKDDVQYEVLYGPFGTPIVTGGLAPATIGWIPFGFAGGLYDPETGLVHFGARDYDPEIGRWISKDPIRFAGGQTNLYVYVHNDPVNLQDSGGMSCLSAEVNLATAYAGAQVACVAAGAELFANPLADVACALALGAEAAATLDYNDQCDPPPPLPAPSRTCH